MMHDTDHIVGRAAFMEKCKPKYKGRQSRRNSKSRKPAVTRCSLFSEAGGKFELPTNGLKVRSSRLEEGASGTVPNLLLDPDPGLRDHFPPPFDFLPDLLEHLFECAAGGCNAVGARSFVHFFQ